MEQSRESSSIFPLHLSVVIVKKGTFGLLLTIVASFMYIKLVPSYFKYKVY